MNWKYILKICALYLNILFSFMYNIFVISYYCLSEVWKVNKMSPSISSLMELLFTFCLICAGLHEHKKWFHMIFIISIYFYLFSIHYYFYVWHKQFWNQNLIKGFFTNIYLYCFLCLLFGLLLARYFSFKLKFFSGIVYRSIFDFL